MVTTTELLKTPQDFIDEETENIKTYLADHNDVQVNKLGIIGFMMNLLGNIRYDSTQYYQKLFIESNASTARDEIIYICMLLYTDTLQQWPHLQKQMVCLVLILLTYRQTLLLLKEL